ncbi:hypothetical protein [Streptomyces hebeiensis]
MTATYETVVEPTVQITFTEELEPEHHIAVERSIQGMAAHAAQQTDRVRAAEAEHAKLAAALNAPLARLVESDPASAEALQELRTRPLPLELDSVGVLHPEDTSAAAEEATLSVRNIQTHVWGPPYHFSWFWHRTNGSPPFNRVIDRPTGQVGLDGRSGSPGAIPGGASTFVEAHAGFGLLFHPPTNGVLVGDSLRRVHDSFGVAAYGIGSNATVEGGTECTILEDGQFRKGATHRLYRKRVSVNESDHAITPGFFTDSPMSVQWPVRAGHEYTFNVGVWVYCDHTAGVGRSAAQSLCQAIIPSMTTTVPL